MNPSDSTAINTFLVSGGVTAAVYLIVAQVRPFIEGPLPPTARLHDPVLRLLALGLGIIIEVVAHGLIAPLSSQRVFLDVGLGAAAGLAAMGIHALGKPTPDAVTQLEPATFVQGTALLPQHVIVEHVVTPTPPPVTASVTASANVPSDPLTASLRSTVATMPPPLPPPVEPPATVSTSASRMSWSSPAPVGQPAITGPTDIITATTPTTSPG